MPPLTRKILSNLQHAINNVPEQVNAFKTQSDSEKNERVKERKLFQKLLAKLAGNEKDDQLAFLMEIARKINRKTYVQAALESIPTTEDYESREKIRIVRKLLAKLTGNDKDAQLEFLMKVARKTSRQTYVQVALETIPIPPDYASLEKKNRQTHAHVHNLIDKVLPIAAGSQSLLSQQKVLENRWVYLHKKPFIPSVTSFEGHKKLLKSVSNPEDLLNILEVAIELITTEHHPNQNENIQKNVTQKKKCELLCKLTKRFFIVLCQLYQCILCSARKRDEIILKSTILLIRFYLLYPARHLKRSNYSS